MPIKITNTGSVVYKPKYMGPKQYTDQFTGRIFNTVDSGVVAPYERTGIGTGGTEAPNPVTIATRLESSSSDGKTLPATKGSDATLKSINCLSFDGTDDELNTGYQPTGDFVVDARIKLDSVTNQKTIHSCNGNDGYFFRVSNGQWQIYVAGGYAIVSTVLLRPVVDTIYDTRVEYTASSDTWVLKVKLHTDSTYTTVGSGTTSTPDFSTANVVLGQKGNGGFFDGEYHSFKFTDGGNVKVHYPLAEGSGTKAYDISGNGNHGTITGATWTTQNSIESWNHEYGFDASAVFDGSDDYVDTGVSITDEYTFEVTAKLNSDSDYQGYFQANKRFFFGRNASSTIRLGYMTFNSSETVNSSIYDKFTTYKIEGGKLFIDGVETIDSGVTPTGTVLGNLYIGARFNDISDVADEFVDQELKNAKIYDNNGVLVRDFVPSEDGLYDKVNGVYYSNDGTGTITTKRYPALNTKTKQVATFDGVADKLTATGITASSVITHDGTATLTAGTGEITSNAGTAYNIKVDGVLTFTMSSGIGTSTITSENGAIGNASVTVGSGGLESFWGTRVADNNGVLVSTDYSTGNTSISNPAGFVHNGSECSISFNSRSLAASSLSDFQNNVELGLSGVWINKTNDGFATELVEYDNSYTRASSGATFAVNTKYFDGREI